MSGSESQTTIEGDSPPPTESINVSGKQADRLIEEFPTESELVDYLKNGGDITDFSGLGGTTARRVRNWFEDEHPKAHRARIESDWSIVTEFYQQDTQDHEEYLWGFICPRCDNQNPLKGDPSGFRGRVFACTTCYWKVLLHADPLDEFIERVKEADDYDWLPDSYNPDDDLWDRVNAIGEIEGSPEVHALGVDGTRIILGVPHDVSERHERLKLTAGGKPHNWEYEAIITDGDNENYIRAVDMDADAEDVQSETKLAGQFDLRLYNVDAPELTDAERDEAIQGGL